MPYIGNTPALDYISYAVQNFTVTAGTTVYTLDYSVANENDIRLVINNVIQRPGASYAYSATGTTLTLTSATLSTDTMYAVFIGRAVQTVLPPANINIQLADGTAAAPSLNFANDTNTGIFRPTTDTIALTEGGVEGMRLNSSGNVQFAGNIGLGGATPTTSGTGITFPASQSASSNANTLDDYEEGTFSPTIATGFTGTPVYSSGDNYGRYTKIGNIVYIHASVKIDSGITASATGLQYGGLPFTSLNAGVIPGGFYFTYNLSWASGGTASFYMTMNSNNTTFFITGANGIGVNGNNASLSLQGTVFNYTGFYIV